MLAFTNSLKRITRKSSQKNKKHGILSHLFKILTIFETKGAHLKISGSIYSDKRGDWRQSLEDLHNNQADMIHVDCNDDPAVLDDIILFKENSELPIDLHLITDEPEKYLAQLKKTPVEYITLQHEELKKNPTQFLNAITGKKGLAITSNTSIDVFDEYADLYDFILFMATVPGQSGGQFDASNFAKIRAFQNKYPNKKVHVDGGVNAEVSFILRNMGVYSSVSGSYLFNAESMGAAMMNLKNNEISSQFKVKDIMRTLDETPTVDENTAFTDVLTSIDEGKMGATMVVDADKKLAGIISNADLRKALTAAYPDMANITVKATLNATPVTINEKNTVAEMLSTIKKQTFPIMYLPVVDDHKKLVGSVTFMNLIKGEL